MRRGNKSVKTILSIFHNDIKSITRSVFVLLIVAALAVMPSLYAWINIFATWDPYVNTGDLPVALASRDSGIDKNGVHINRAEEMISEIRNDTNIKYCPLEDPEEAWDAYNVLMEQWDQPFADALAEAGLESPMEPGHAKRARETIEAQLPD